MSQNALIYNLQSSREKRERKIIIKQYSKIFQVRSKLAYRSKDFNITSILDDKRHHAKIKRP